MEDGLPYSKNNYARSPSHIKPQVQHLKGKESWLEGGGGGGAKTTGRRTVKTKLREVGLRWKGGGGGSWECSKRPRDGRRLLWPSASPRAMGMIE